MEDNYGKLVIKLKELLEEKKMSKNKLSHKAEMSWHQIDGYYNNTITRLDTYVLCKICSALDCKIEDVLEYVPASSPQEDAAGDREEGQR